MDMGTFLIAFGAVLTTTVCMRMLQAVLTKNTAPFLFTLPFSRRQFVLEKYLFCMGASLLVLLVSALLVGVLGKASWLEAGTVSLAVLCVLLIFQGLMIPLTLRYSENSMLYFLAMGGAMALLFGGVYVMDLDPAQISSFFLQNWAWIMAGVLAGALIIWLVSIPISVRILDRQTENF